MDDSHMIKNSQPSASRPHLHTPLHSDMFSDQAQTPPAGHPLYTIGVPGKFLFGFGKTESNKALKEPDLAERMTQDQKTIGSLGMKRCSSSPGLLNTTHMAVTGKVMMGSEAPHAKEDMGDTVSKLVEKSMEQSPVKRDSKSLPNTPTGSPKNHRKQMVEYHGKHAINKFGSMFRKKTETALPKITESNDGIEKVSDMGLSERFKNWMVHSPVVSSQKDMNIYSPTSF